jgi:hypothetical protein
VALILRGLRDRNNPTKQATQPTTSVPKNIRPCTVSDSPTADAKLRHNGDVVIAIYGIGAITRSAKSKIL